MATKTIKKTLVLTALFSQFLISCVSVQLGPQRKEAKNFSYAEPGEPFTEMPKENLKNTWRNHMNDNLISIFTNCSRGNGLSLQRQKKELLSAFESHKVLNEYYLRVDGQASLATVAKGSLDGVEIEAKFIILRQGQCVYSLSYVAQATYFADDLEHFDHFVEGFQIK